MSFVEVKCDLVKFISQEKVGLHTIGLYMLGVQKIDLTR
jgi:hypothetical protein